MVNHLLDAYDVPDVLLDPLHTSPCIIFTGTTPGVADTLSPLYN